jgi:hypothetical protein
MRNSHNLVKSIKDAEGNSVEDMEGIKRIVINFYQKLLGETSHSFTLNKAERISRLVQKRFSAGCIMGMEAAVTREDVRKTMFYLKKNKAPSLFGYSAGFYHSAWEVVGEDVVDAVLEFFSSGRLLKETNATIITLVPKKNNPSSMSDYRPIYCCNVVYKCIIKILANRLRPGLEDIISLNQGAFIPNRSIVENILLAQEIVSDYHKDGGRPRCTLKVDLMKAYDSVSWAFILHCLRCFGAPLRFVKWIKECISSPCFTIAMNGSLVGFFLGRKGLRQGDPISPYLFVIAMEMFSLLLTEAATIDPRFGFHPKCHSLGLTHLCFADDLLIVSAATTDSIRVIQGVLVEFEDLSGLKANPTKSSSFSFFSFFFFALESLLKRSNVYWKPCRWLKVVSL